MNPFDRMYEGDPPWETGRPQAFLVRLLEEGAIEGSVVDIGCGTGENALHLSANGHPTVGIDASRVAIGKARAKAERRRSAARFQVGDVLDPRALRTLDRSFDTALDSGVFHVFTDAGREAYVRSVATVLRPGAVLHLACFSDREPDWGGPRRVSKREIEHTFRDGWAVESIEPVRFETKANEAGAQAWLARIVFIGRALGTS